MTLPEGWEIAQIGDLCDLINGMAFKPSDWARKGLPIIRIQNLNRSDTEFNYYAKEVHERFLVESGELLFAWSGTPGTSFGAHIWSGPRAVLNQHIFRVRFNEEEFNKKFFKLAINAKLAELIGNAHGGVGLAHVTKGKFEATTVSVPPFSEQRRIVAKLDALTTRLARARAELDRVPALADRLRAASLSAVFNQPNNRNIKLGEILEEIQAGKNLKCEERPPQHGEKGVVKVSSVSSETFQPSKAKILPKNYEPLDRDLIKKGDLLFARASGSLGLVGRVALVTVNPENLYLSDKILRLLVKPEQTYWVYWFLRSPEGRQQVEKAATGISMHNITQSSLRNILIPMPDEAYRNLYIELLKSVFARADRLEAEAARARALLDRLEAAILAKAFRGELVPQDPADEPASLLLDRIRARRGNAQRGNARRGNARRGGAQSRPDPGASSRAR